MDQETNTAFAIKITLVLVALCLKMLSGCVNPTEDKAADYENARRAAIDAWEELIGRVSDECYDRSTDAMIMESGKFPESCIPTIKGKYIGCYLATDDYGIGGDMIYLLESRTTLQKLDTAVHEYIHLLSNCESTHVLDLLLLSECLADFLDDKEPDEECVEIPGDYFHLDERLWDDYGSDTVEAVGCANLEL